MTTEPHDHANLDSDAQLSWSSPTDEQRASPDGAVGLRRWGASWATAAAAASATFMLHAWLSDRAGAIANACGAESRILWLLAALIVGVVLVTFAVKAFGRGVVQHRDLALWPPAWVTVTIACLLFVALRSVDAQLAQEPTPPPDSLFVVCALVVGGTAFILLLPNGGRSPSSMSNAEAVVDSAQRDSNPEGWWRREDPVSVPDEDRFGFSIVADRISDRLIASWRTGDSATHAVIGLTGSGKSSIAKLVEYRLRLSTSRCTFVTASLWGATSLDSSLLIVTHAVTDHLADIVDPTTTAGVARGVVRGVSPDASLFGWFGSILSSSRDADEALKRIDNVLRALDQRIVLAIEDAERVADSVGVSTIGALLDRLRQVDRVSVLVLTASDSHRARALAASRLCDFVEPVPQLTPTQVIAELEALRKRMLG